MGRTAHLRLSRRWHQRDHGRLRAGGGPRLRAGPPRRDGRVHGLRACEVHGRGGRLPRHVRARRDPSAERSLRREDGSPAGGGDRRTVVTARHRRLVSAGSRSAVAVQGRRVGVREHGDCARAGAASRRPRGPHRAFGAHRHLHRLPARPAGREDGAAAARALHDSFRHRLDVAARDSEGRGSPPRRRCAQRWKEAGDPRRRRRDARDR